MSEGHRIDTLADQLSFLIYFYMFETADAARVRAAGRLGAKPYAGAFVGDWTLRNPRNAREPGAETVPREALRGSDWANALNGQIFFADEAGVRSNSHHSGTTWAPMGQTPVVPATGKRFGLNLVSAVSPQGVLRFMVVDGRMTAVRFIEFLKRLLHNQTRPIFLIVDQHSSHRAKVVQEFVASTDGRLELFFLPPVLLGTQSG